VANVITAGSLLPTSDNLYSIGTGDLRWTHLHLDSAAAGIYFSANTLGIDSSGALSYNSGTGNVAFGNITFQDGSTQSVAFTPDGLRGNLIPFTSNAYNIGSATQRWGNVYVGPYSIHLQDQITGNDVEMVIDNGTLYLNGAQNIAVGNLVIRDTTLETATPSTPIFLGNIADTGNVVIGRTAQITSTNFPSDRAALTISGTGTDLGPYAFSNTLLRVVSKPNTTARAALEAYGANVYGVYTARVGRGTIASPTATKDGDVIVRLSGQGFGTTKFGAAADGRIDVAAAEDFTDTAHGTQIDFWTTAIGTNTSAISASITSTGVTANAITFSTDSTTQTTAGIPQTQFAVANGVATLGIDGRLTTSQIPSSLVGAIVFQGGWDATNNTPTLSDGTGTAGYQYIVTVGGTRNLGHGSEEFAPGDTVTYGGNIWNHVQATAPISSIAGNAHMNISPTTGAVIVGVDATPNNTANAIVSRDSSGNFIANTITASLNGVALSAVTAATVTTAAQPSITSVGSLTSLTVVGNVASGNVSGTTGTFTRIIGTLVTAAQPNITSVGVLTGLTLSSGITGTALNAATIGNVGANLIGTLGTNAQPNITSVGTLTALSVSGNISDSIGSVRSIPQNGQTANYTLQSSDNGQMVNITAGNVTIPAGIFASPYGQTISIFNNQNSSNSVVQGSGVTLRLAGTASTGNRVLVRYGLATVVCVAANTFVISGAGLL
jgi:hypothetical protein